MSARNAWNAAGTRLESSLTWTLQSPHAKSLKLEKATPPGGSRAYVSITSWLMKSDSNAANRCAYHAHLDVDNMSRHSEADLNQVDVDTEHRH